MEIRLTRGPYGSWANSYGSGMICHQGLMRAIDLKKPKQIKNLFVVFSKTKSGDHDYFTIVRGPSQRVGRAFILETGVQLLWGAYQALGRAYSRGYRFLHFEVTYMSAAVRARARVWRASSTCAS